MSKKQQRKARQARKRRLAAKQPAASAASLVSSGQQPAAGSQDPLASARSLILSGRFAAAREQLEAMTREQPKAKTLALLGLAQVGCGDAAAAKRSIEQAMRLGWESSTDLASLGAAAFREGNGSRAELAFALAVHVQPDSFDNRINLAMVIHRNGNLPAAVTAYDAALQLRDDHFDAWYNRGVALKCLERLAEARESFERARALRADHLDLLCNLGQVAQRLERFDEAESWFAAAMRIRPDRADLAFCRGNVCLDAEDFAAAAEHYQQSLRLDSTNVEAWNNLGASQRKLLDDHAALASFQRALQLDPRHQRALENLGEIHTARGEHKSAEACFAEAVAVEDGNLSLQMKLGRAKRRLEDNAGAAGCYRRIVEQDPNHAEALAELGMIEFHRGAVQQSHRMLQRAIDSQPQNPLNYYLRATSLPVIYRDRAEIEQAREHVAASLAAMRERNLQLDPHRHTPNTMFYLAYHGENDRELQQLAASVWKPVDAVVEGSGHSNDRLRVGFLTRYLTGHTIGVLTGGLIAGLDSDRFETTTIALDGQHPWFEQNSDRFLVAPPKPSDLIRFVSEQRFDVLIFPEVGMDPLTNAVARARMAPLQCAMWGHPVTTGSPSIDYFISSELIETDEAGKHYSEHLALLPTLPAYYFKPNDEQPPASRAQLGLPESKTLYACPQSLFKFHPDFDPVMDRILDGDPNGVIVLIEGGDANWTRLLRERFENTMRHAERVLFLPRMGGRDFCTLLAESEVILDPLHFGGGRSNYLAMAAGTPLVTLPSQYMRGRVAAGMYRKLDYQECVVDSPEQYVQKCLALGLDQDYRREVGRQIRDRSDCLFEDQQAIRQLEIFLDAAHRLGGKFAEAS